VFDVHSEINLYVDRHSILFLYIWSINITVVQWVPMAKLAVITTLSI